MLQAVRERKTLAPPPKVVLVGGPSGIGKTSILTALVDLHPNLYSRPHSFTSRSRRVGEGIDEYSFVTREEMVSMHGSGMFICLDEIYGNLYATSLQSVTDVLASGRTSVKEVHPRNHTKVRKHFPDLVSVLLLPVTLDDAEPAGLGRRCRSTEDRRVYDHIDLLDFDLVLHVDRSRPVSAVAANLHFGLSRLSLFDAMFPRPPVVDAANAVGYNMVAEQFTEDQRITTANFHALSESFFTQCLTTYVAAGARCLELGPGRGWLRKEFAWPQVDYMAVDVSPAMAELNHGDQVEIGSIRALNLPDMCVDVVIASLSDPYLFPAALVEVRRVLKSSGTFIFTTPSGTWARGLRIGPHANTTTFCLANGSKSQVYSFTYEMEELRWLLHQCGFTCERLEGATADELLGRMRISPAIIQSAAALGMVLSELTVIHMVVARREDAG